MPVSFDLTEDQLELQKWVHEFAANVVRPAAAEYDEREAFPWEVLQEAAKIGLYSLDFFATQWFDESGLGIPITMEELLDRKSTRLNSSHANISYAVFCLKKKKTTPSDLETASTF